jgi:hypothetical protein
MTTIPRQHLGVRGIVVAVAASVISAIAFATPAHAAGPQVDWDCELIRTQGTFGTVVLFAPRAQVSWSGRKLTYTMLSWSSSDTRKSQAGRKYGTITGGNGLNTYDLDLSQEFFTGEEYEYKKVLLKVKDSSGRTFTSKCVWDGPTANGY